MGLVKMTQHCRHEVLGVYFLDDSIRPRFVVVFYGNKWRTILQQYGQDVVESTRKPGYFSMSFNFHGLYAAMLSYFPFANAVLDTEQYSRDQLLRVCEYFPSLSAKLNPLTIKLSYDYVTPKEKDPERK